METLADELRISSQKLMASSPQELMTSSPAQELMTSSPAQELMTYDDEKLVPAVHSLDQLIDELHKVFDSDRVNVDYVRALMGAYKSNPKDWKAFAKFDPYRYTRNLVDAGNGKFNLIALCWGEGHGSSIHDHSDADCFMKILAGELVETAFAWPTSSSPTGSGYEGKTGGVTVDEEAPMVEIRRNVYKKDSVAYICDSIGLHRVENASHSDKAVSLHLYSPPFSSCHIFDQRTGHQSVAQITFWSKYGQRPNPPAPDTTNNCNQCAEEKSSTIQPIEMKSQPLLNQ